ncbi:DMT family transporter [Glycomyces tenuis]|uniref:DMT family transporter n=1 Tax=Glycomyces tenuis TaxID=58116 RepID=UPI0003F6C394|nr:multidrug efflux SMR transporter [Glycomyces tenuis]
MAWIVLLVSAVFEAVWATALGLSEGFSEPVPTVVFAAALAASMFGLGWAVKHIPIGTAYAVWVGVGAALTVAYAMATGTESVSAAKLVFIAGIIAAVVGLKLVPSGAERKRAAEDDADEAA